MWKQNADKTTDTKSFNKWMFEDAKKSLEAYNKQMLEEKNKLTTNEFNKVNHKSLNTVASNPNNTKNNL